jgi:hypothetical protein
MQKMSKHLVCAPGSSDSARGARALMHHFNIYESFFLKYQYIQFCLKFEEEQL